MFSVWTKHLTDTKKQDSFRDTVKGSKQVLDRAIEILKEEEQQLTLEEMNSSNYTQGWDYKQAHNNGIRAGLNKAIKLLTLDQGK